MTAAVQPPPLRPHVGETIRYKRKQKDDSIQIGRVEGFKGEYIVKVFTGRRGQPRDVALAEIISIHTGWLDAELRDVGSEVVKHPRGSITSFLGGFSVAYVVQRFFGGMIEKAGDRILGGVWDYLLSLFGWS